MLHANIAVRGFVTISSVAMLLQNLPVATPVLDSVSKLTLDGALVLALVALWKAYNKKDDQVVAMATKVTETMTLVTAAIEKTTTAVASLSVRLEDLQTTIQNLQREIEVKSAKSSK